MMSIKHCDSCKEEAVGIYTLADFPDKPSILCYQHGRRYLQDARDNGLEASRKLLQNEDKAVTATEG